jgi:hypothetical protein
MTHDNHATFGETELFVQGLDCILIFFPYQNSASHRTGQSREYSEHWRNNDIFDRISIVANLLLLKQIFLIHPQTLPEVQHFSQKILCILTMYIENQEIKQWESWVIKIDLSVLLGCKEIRNSTTYGDETSSAEPRL